MNYRFWLIILLATASIINIANALDCSKCHTDAGRVVVAKDTIEVGNETCLQCHSSNYPPTPIGYNTHLVHKGKYSVNVDFLSRHPTSPSLNCDICHRQIIECRNCHVKGIPHINPPLGYDCKGCHGEVDNLFRHPVINLKIHNLFNGSNKCTMCHNPDNMRTLRLASGGDVSIQEPHRLCYQCHSSFYNSWNSGSHYANKTVPNEIKVQEKEFPAVKRDWEDNWRKENTCTNCHNPHNPIELYQLPSLKIITSSGSSTTLYVVAIILVLTIGIVTVKKRENLKLIISKLASKLPKKLPRFSLPISISLESEHGNATDKIETDKIETDKIVVKTAQNTEKKKLSKILSKSLKNKNILFIFCLVLMFGIFYLGFGTFFPMKVVTSESMSPHINRGDLVFYTDINRINEIGTHDKKENYNFGDYGDVVIYKPLGGENSIPFIHRAMYYVEEGKEMWQGGPVAPHEGYITKGDNIVTNPKHDQQEIRISYQEPVKKEWIIGIARFRIPYIGYIRMLFSWQ